MQISKMTDEKRLDRYVKGLQLLLKSVQDEELEANKLCPL